MGRAIDALAAKADASVTMRLASGDNRNGSALTPAALSGTDVAIDFSSASAVGGNVERYCEAGTNAVVGVTGWEADRDRALALATEAGIGLVHGSNFSIGANAFLELVERATEAMAGCGELFDLVASETHHRRKLDAPSGTAIRMTEVVRSAGWPRPVEVVSRRLGHVPGSHELTWDSEVDTIAVSHAARSRHGFALGALRAARWIRGRSGVHEFSRCWREVVERGR